MRLVRNPVAQFLAVGVLTAVLIALGTWVLSGRAASEEATTDARATTEILAHSVAEPAIPRGLAAGDAGAVDRFDRRVVDRLLVQDVLRIKIWNADGTIVYSDRPELIGTSYDLGDEELEILESGGSEAEVSDLGRPENRFERSRSGVVEVYTSDRLAGGRAAAVRGLLRRRRPRRPQAGGLPAVLPDHPRRAARSCSPWPPRCSGCSPGG